MNAPGYSFLISIRTQLQNIPIGINVSFAPLVFVVIAASATQIITSQAISTNSACTPAIQPVLIKVIVFVKVRRHVPLIYVAGDRSTRSRKGTANRMFVN